MIVDIFILFFKIGLFTFGGGYAMIPLITYEIVDKGYMVLSEIVNFISIAESTPGVFAVNISTFIGQKTNGFFGAVVATCAVVLPSFIITIFICNHFKKVQENRVLSSTFSGLYPVVIVFLLKAVIDMGLIILLQKTQGFDIINFANFINVNAVIIFLALAVINFFKKLSPISVVFSSAVLGIIFYGF